MTIRAPIAGTVWKVVVTIGQAVAAEQTVIILESMKMQIPVAAQAAGRVVRVLVAPGDAVDEDAELVEIA